MAQKRVLSSENKFLASLKYLQKEILRDCAFQRIATVNPDLRREQLIKKIEDIVLQTVRSAADPSSVPCLQLRPRRSQWKDCNFDQKLTLKARCDAPSLEIKYTTHKKRFDILFNIMFKVYRLLQTKGTVTKRELYYEQTELFGSQNAVNSALYDICCLLDASPWELRVLSTSKGLVAGDLTITMTDKKVIDCSKRGGVQIPQNVKEILKVESKANFILLVEKDAAFQKLLDDEAHTKFGPSILVTGKGEPDINTRLLVNRLYQDLTIPVLIVVDADPYGIEIMCTYRFGSLTLSQHSDHLAVAQVRWLGIHPTDVAKFTIPATCLTERDLAKARDLANRPYVMQNQLLLEQVNCLLETGKKCEIENLTALSPNFLTDMFLSYKITSREVI